jgi:membrane-bound lytic murein transglycosylase B
MRARALRFFIALLAAGLAFQASSAGSGQFAPSVDRSFRNFIASIWPLAKERGISRKTFDKAFAGVTFDPKVVANAQNQAEFARPIWQYIETAVSPNRIQRGRERLQEEKTWFEKATQIYGVDKGVIVGVWGLETDFGASPGSDDIVRALTTLAYVHFRGDYFRDELLSALVILEDGDIAPRRMRGSWAGAMGQTQFMPSSFLAYAVDFETHGRRDIWTSAPDAIGSTANFLSSHGWNAALPWGFEVQLPGEFALTDADSSRFGPFTAFAARGVRRANGAPMPKLGEARLFFPAGLKGPIFLITSNFDVIKSYNPSTAYALAVGLLGDAVKGGADLVAPWPTNERALDETQVRTLQAKLTKIGYKVGEIDGMVGESLRAAVRAYQERNGLPPDGYADPALLKRIMLENNPLQSRVSPN